MTGELKVVRRVSKSGREYTAVVFSPEDSSLTEFVVTFDALVCYRMADMEKVPFSEYVEDERN